MMSKQTIKPFQKAVKELGDKEKIREKGKKRVVGEYKQQNTEGS